MNLSIIISLIALVIAVLSFLLNLIQFILKKNSDKRKYANLFFAHLCDHRTVSANSEQLTGLVEISNDANLPIKEVFVLLTSNKSYGNLNKLTLVDKYTSVNYLESVIPGKMHISCSLNGSAAGGEHDAVAIIFSDVDGNTWYKNAQNELYKIKEKDKIKFFRKVELYMPYPRATEVQI